LESPNRLVSFVLEIRKSLLRLGLALAVCFLGFYLISPHLLFYIQLHLHQKLAFFSIAEPFLAHAKLAFFTALFCLMPGIIYTFWQALAIPFKLKESTIGWFVLSTGVLFYAGAAFCYFITLPFGVEFLLGYQTAQLKPVIAVGKFVSFAAIFILAFGLIFELPIFMIFSARVGLIPRTTFEKNRRYAILVISIVAALLTPTPDVVNMALMGFPLYLLYEAGIIVLKITDQ